MSGAGPKEVQEESGKGGGYAAIRLISAAFHKPELASQGCLCLGFPSCKANDVTNHLTLLFFVFFLVRNAIEPWLKGAKGVYATGRQQVMG